MVTVASRFAPHTVGTSGRQYPGGSGGVVEEDGHLAAVWIGHAEAAVPSHRSPEGGAASAKPRRAELLRPGVDLRRGLDLEADLDPVARRAARRAGS